MKFLIVGANFKNKGAQSMLFVSVDEIKKRYPEAEVYFASVEQIDEEKYNFKKLHYAEGAKLLALAEKKRYGKLAIRFLKDIVKFILRQNNSVLHYLDVKKLFPSLDVMIDVSGFNLGMKWDEATHEKYLNNVRLARKYNIPIYLMPQSFGPFNYPPEREFLKDEMRETLPYVKKIFAREEEGKKLLTEELGLNNVESSVDIVLQNPKVNMHNIFKATPKMIIPVIETENNVGIIPNQQCLRHGDKEKILRLYQGIVSALLREEKEVYLFRHSKEDLSVCNDIKALFNDEEKVHLLENDFSCFEYDSFIRIFDYIICSRYHGIVHGYKNAIPCIALGWAIKYEELAKNVGQEEFVFDITSDSFSVEQVLQTIATMNKNHKAESEKIKDYVDKIQKVNCFSFLSEVRK